MEMNTNLCTNQNNSSYPNNINYTLIQLKLPLVFDEIIDFNDPVYSFVTLLEKVDLKKYFISNVKNKGRKGYNHVTLLKVVLFAFQIRGYASTREIADLCKNDIRFRWILQYEDDFPSHMTISNFINNCLKDKIEDIFADITLAIFNKHNVDTEHLYLDGTKIEANANKYSWVWKKACITNRDKLFEKITNLLNDININCSYYGTTYQTRDIYEINYLESVFKDFINNNKIDTKTFVYGKGNHKTKEQVYYELLHSYINKLKEYSEKIETCGDIRNSYSKTDKDATFMRIKKDYMGNDQLLPAYNIQIGACDEYIACLDVNQYASDADCFVPLIEKFKSIYKKYPKYPVADAGYGTYNNYIYCEENNMEKYMKFASYKKATEDKKYINDPYRVVNFKKDENGQLICPNNKKFIKLYDRKVKNNKYGRTEEIYQCEDCSDCPLKSKCTKAQNNRTINVNNELTSYHQEVLDNLNSIHGALLRMNRSIQAEGVFGIMKQDRRYKRIVRKGLKSVTLELYLIAIGFNLYKFNNIIKRGKN